MIIHLHHRRDGIGLLALIALLVLGAIALYYLYKLLHGMGQASDTTVRYYSNRLEQADNLVGYRGATVGSGPALALPELPAAEAGRVIWAVWRSETPIGPWRIAGVALGTAAEAEEALRQQAALAGAQQTNAAGYFRAERVEGAR